nr:hypothetical protein [Candidatus Microthrix sp.]
MFDFVDTSGLPDAKAVFAEAEARRDPDRELRAPGVDRGGFGG